MGSDQGIYPEPCTRCGEREVEWFWFSDHYDSGSGVECKNCGVNDFTEREVEQMRGIQDRIKDLKEVIKSFKNTREMVLKDRNNMESVYKEKIILINKQVRELEKKLVELITTRDPVS